MLKSKLSKVEGVINGKTEAMRLYYAPKFRLTNGQKSKLSQFYKEKLSANFDIPIDNLGVDFFEDNYSIKKIRPLAIVIGIKDSVPENNPIHIDRNLWKFIERTKRSKEDPLKTMKPFIKL